jgi:GNAT superfamily N-acetyltransferase
LNDAAMKIRDAAPDDAPAACGVIRRSIAELCSADHHHDPAILGRWLGNKTPEIFRSWIRPNNALLVAVEDRDILAVGCVNDTGEITLNYISPDARFRGISSALLEALERRAMEWDYQRCTVKSTETAGAFTSRGDILKMDRLTENSA